MELDTSGVKNELIAIEYPGVVKNVDKMLKTVGGLSEVTKVLQSSNRRLELKFRPDDIYCKPVCGDKCRSNTLLLKVKVARIRNKNTGEIKAKGEIKIVGRVTTVFKFKSLCDFQYLPMEFMDGKMENLSTHMLPRDISENNLQKWLDAPIPYFFPPPAFARVDNLALNSYMYRGQSNSDGTNDCKVIGRTRKRRNGHTVFVSFDVKTIPTKPKERAMKFIQIKMLDKQFETVKECFERRPIWSKFALSCETKLGHDTLKYVLPATAYYFVTGPFRVMWVKFGLDPRSNPEYKIYQSLDYRIRALAGLTNKIKAKRPYTSYQLPNKSPHVSKQAASIMTSKNIDELEELDNAKTPKMKGDEHIFTPSSIPSSRQMIYQYCDLKVPEVESLFARLPKDPPDAVCDPRNGFLPRGFDVHCRDVLTEYISKNLKQQNDSLNDAEIEENLSSCDDEEDDREESWLIENVKDEEIDESDDD